jgi:hypothetical protein
MGGFCSDLRIDPDTYQPDFHLQKGEEVIYTLKCTKRSLPPLLAAILTLITFGIFLFFKDAFKKVRSVEIIVLTNKRVLEWEYRVPRRNGDPHSTFQHSYIVSDMVYYQHEIVQDKPMCFGCIKTRPFNTLRIFFNKYPSIHPPSYNNSPSMKPVASQALSVANLTKNVVMNGLVQNWVGLAIEGLKLLFKIVEILSSLFSPSRGEVLLPGHYIEIDTNDKGSTQHILTFLQHLVNVYQRRNILRGPHREGAVVLGNEDVPLWESKDGPVRLNPNILQLGREEQVFDANTHYVRITFMDWLLAVATLSIYYWLVIRDLKNYRGALLVTDRRFVSVFSHNQKGLVPDQKYIQLVNCWFLTKMNSAVVQTTRPSDCISACFQPTWRTLMVDCGPGSLSITPDYSNSEEVIESLFSKFFTYRSRPLLNSMPVAFKESNEIGLPNRYRIENEVLLYDIASHTPEDCAFNCMRILCCGFAPPMITHDIGISSHRLYVKFTVSNGHYKNYLTLDFFTRLENVHGLELAEVVIGKGKCCTIANSHVGICFRNDESWTLSMWIRNADLNSEVIKNAGQAVSYVQTVLEDNEVAYINHVLAAPAGAPPPMYAAPPISVEVR